MDNLEFYNKVRSVPAEALKPIKGGRLKGMTDVNPMWRIKTLTEQFGMCGVGWYFEPTSRFIEYFDNAKEAVATIAGNLYVKQDGEWSKPIYGEGGAKIVAEEKGGLFVDDDAFKKAYTDALSVACKSIGIAADVYFEKDTDKYTAIPESEYKAVAKPASTASSKASTSSSRASTSAECKKYRQLIIAYAKEHGMTTKEVCSDYHINNDSPLDALKRAYEDLTSPSLLPQDDEDDIQDQFAALDEQVPF